MADRPRKHAFSHRRSVSVERLSLLPVTCFLLGVLGAGSVAAQEKLSPTLNKIRASGTLYVGNGESSVPFSYLDADGKVIGFSVDLCGRVIDVVKRRLNLPKLTVVLVPTSPGSRQMMLEAGTTDLHCEALTNTLQRQRFVSFSVSLYAAEIKALVRKDSGIRSLGDLKGKRIAITAGTTSEPTVRAAALRQNVALNFQHGRNHEDSLRQVLDGRADAMVLDDVLLRVLLMNLPEAEAAGLVVLEDVFSVEPYGLMFRRNDLEFKKLVDDTLIELMQSGEYARLYGQWFVAPIPPANRSLDLPMSGILKQLIANPNDRGV